MAVFRSWYRRNKLFVLFVLWTLAAYIVPASYYKDTELVLNISAYVLQLSGLGITIIGLLSVRTEFGAKSPLELFTGLFTFKLPAPKSGGGCLLSISQTVLDVSPVTPDECADRDERIDRNIAALYECINNDRFSIRHFMDTQKVTENQIRNEVLPRIGKLHRTTENINFHGSGLALTGLIWVGIGITQAALMSIWPMLYRSF